MSVSYPPVSERSGRGSAPAQAAHRWRS